MNIKTVALRGLGVLDEPIIPVKFIGVLTLKQLLTLVIAVFSSYGVYHIGQIYYAPIIMIFALYITFAKGKTFTPYSTIYNYFMFLARNFTKYEDDREAKPIEFSFLKRLKKN